MFDELLSPLFSSAWGRNVGIGISISMVLLLCYSLFTAILNLRSDIHLVRPKIFVNDTIHTADNELILRINEIPNLHLFGTAAELNTSAVIPITSLALRLVGITKAVPENLSRVIISENGRTGKLYQVGDLLPEGVRVYSILDDGIILENGGRLEKLPFQRHQLHFQGMPQSLLDAQGDYAF